jgi:hypothetical protein
MHLMNVAKRWYLVQALSMNRDSTRMTLGSFLRLRRDWIAWWHLQIWIRGQRLTFDLISSFTT